MAEIVKYLTSKGFKVEDYPLKPEHGDHFEYLVKTYEPIFTKGVITHYKDIATGYLYESEDFIPWILAKVDAQY